MDDPEVFDPADERPEVPSEERNLALAAHLLGLVSSFVGPLVMYFVVDGAFAKDHAREALNFQLTILVFQFAFGLGGLVLSFVLPCFLPVLFLLFLGAWIGSLVWSILGAVAAGQGRPYPYPISLRLVS